MDQLYDVFYIRPVLKMRGVSIFNNKMREMSHLSWRGGTKSVHGPVVTLQPSVLVPNTWFSGHRAGASDNLIKYFKNKICNWSDFSRNLVQTLFTLRRLINRFYNIYFTMLTVSSRSDHLCGTCRKLWCPSVWLQ